MELTKAEIVSVLSKHSSKILEKVFANYNNWQLLVLATVTSRLASLCVWYIRSTFPLENTKYHYILPAS